MKHKTMLRWLLVVVLVLSLASPVLAGNFDVRTLKVLVLTDGVFHQDRIYQSISNANGILEGQVYMNIQIVAIKKVNWNKKKGGRIMVQLRKKAKRFEKKYPFDIAIAYLNLPNRPFMAKCAGRYILVRSTMRGSGIVTSHELGHSFTHHRHDSIGLMAANVAKTKNTSIQADRQLMWKNNRWKTFY
jgi:hypothetical protein